jgi:hypothetical protein
VLAIHSPAAAADAAAPSLEQLLFLSANSHALLNVLHPLRLCCTVLQPNAAAAVLFPCFATCSQGALF